MHQTGSKRTYSNIMALRKICQIIACMRIDVTSAPGSFSNLRSFVLHLQHSLNEQQVLTGYTFGTCVSSTKYIVYNCVIEWVYKKLHSHKSCDVVCSLWICKPGSWISQWTAPCLQMQPTMRMCRCTSSSVCSTSHQSRARPTSKGTADLLLNAISTLAVAATVAVIIAVAQSIHTVCWAGSID